METLKETFSRNFRHMLNESGVKQVEIARKGKTTTTTVQRWLNAESLPGEVNIINLAELLGVAPQEFFKTETPPKVRNLASIFKTLANHSELVELMAQVDDGYLEQLRIELEEYLEAKPQGNSEKAAGKV